MVPAIDKNDLSDKRHIGRVRGLIFEDKKRRSVVVMFQRILKVMPAFALAAVPSFASIAFVSNNRAPFTFAGHTWLGVHAEREYYRYRARFYDDGGTFPVTGALVEYIAAPALSSSPRRLLRAPTRITALPFKTSLPSRWWRARPTLLPRTTSRPGIRTITRLSLIHILGMAR